MKKTLLIVCILSTVVLFEFCSSSRKTQTNVPKLSYASSVQSIVAGTCAPCHVGTAAKQTRLDSYDSVKSNIDDIIRRIQLTPQDRGFMPFKHPKLPDSTIQVFVRWKNEGMLP